MVKSPSIAAIPVMASVRFSGPKRSCPRSPPSRPSRRPEIGRRAAGGSCAVDHRQRADGENQDAPMPSEEHSVAGSGRSTPNANRSSGLGARNAASPATAVAIPEMMRIQPIDDASTAISAFDS